ncbi:hypothetical protein Sjap_009830 [Stephania japonica]|uniref:F-box domain-containing protein n=1 Tax=Stephania japonica TaxID=461633 RepID=A0AAP0J8G0_9MAGN
MADWSQLPKDLLDQIARRLNYDTDILRFRSICSSWRSIASYPPHRFPNRILLNPKSTSGQPDSGCFCLSKHLILRLGLPGSTQGWLVKLEQSVPEKFLILNPLSDSRIRPLPQLFPNFLDLMGVQVTELGQEFVLRYTDNRPFSYTGDVYKEKVIFSSNSVWSDEPDFVIMTIHVSGKLALFSFRDNVWTVIDDLLSPYDDVIHHKGQFYAVDSAGRAVVIEVSNSLMTRDVAPSVFGGDKKYLVESDGELLLVDRHIIADDESDSQSENCVMNYTVKFDVFKLDHVGEVWVEVRNLGDRVLFLGDNCSFSAFASDLSGCRGNCIYFLEKSCKSSREEDDGFNLSGIRVFDLMNGDIELLSPDSVCSQFFWHPPAWIMAMGS